MRHLTIDVSNYDSRLHIGKQGENLTREITFDCAAWLDDLSGGVLSIVHQRPTDPDAYPCGDYVTTDTSLTWSINETDVAFSGLGKCELRYTIGSRIAKTKTFYTEIVNALNPLDTPPEAYEPYIDRVIDASRQEMEDMTVSATATEGQEASVSIEKEYTDHMNLKFNFEIPGGTLPPYTSADQNKGLYVKYDGSLEWSNNGKIYNLGNYASSGEVPLVIYNEIRADLTNGNKKPLFRWNYLWSATATFELADGIQVLFLEDLLGDTGHMFLVKINPPSAISDPLKVTKTDFIIPRCWAESLHPGEPLRLAYMLDDDGDDNIYIGWKAINEFPAATASDVGKVFMGGTKSGGYEWKREELLRDFNNTPAPGLMKRNGQNGDVSVCVSSDEVVFPIRNTIVTLNITKSNITVLDNNTEYTIGKTFATVEIFGNPVFCPIDYIKRDGYDLYYGVQGSPVLVWDGTGEAWVEDYEKKLIIDEANNIVLHDFFMVCGNVMNRYTEVSNYDLVATVAFTGLNTAEPLNITPAEFSAAWKAGKKVYLRVLVYNENEFIMPPVFEEREYTPVDYNAVYYRMFIDGLGGDILAMVYYDDANDVMMARADLINQVPPTLNANEGDVLTVDSNGGKSWMPPAGGSLSPVLLYERSNYDLQNMEMQLSDNVLNYSLIIIKWDTNQNHAVQNVLCPALMLTANLKDNDVQTNNTGQWNYIRIKQGDSTVLQTGGGAGTRNVSVYGIK